MDSLYEITGQYLELAEMTVLVEGIVQEAKQLDIEVLTPDQLAEMRMLEQQAEDRRNGKAQTN